MKITTTTTTVVDITPKEFRECMGLPDMQKHWDSLSTAEKQKAMLDNVMSLNSNVFQTFMANLSNIGKKES